MAKRFTDSEKWQDAWFTELTNDQKIIWIYLLDHCDNAGLWKINMKNLNYFCSTNITVEEFFIIFSKRITKIGEDICYINKFCNFQYGPNFLKSENKAVKSAINRLVEVGIVNLDKGIYTLSIPYGYPIDTPKEKEKEKEKDKVLEQVQLKEEEKDKVKDQEEVKDKIQLKEWEKKELKESIELNIKSTILKDNLIKLILGESLTANQRNEISENKQMLIKLIPALKEII